VKLFKTKCFLCSRKVTDPAKIIMQTADGEVTHDICDQCEEILRKVVEVRDKMTATPDEEEENDVQV